MVCLWKYKTDGWLGDDWHLFADASGRRFFGDLFGKMKRSQVEIRHRVPVTPVSHKVLKIPDYGSPYENRDFLVLNYSPTETRFDEWRIGDNERSVEVTFGRQILENWQLALNRGHLDEPRTVGLREDHVLFVWR